MSSADSVCIVALLSKAMASIKATVVAMSAYFVLVLIISLYRTSGYIVISPSPRAAVCQAGDTLEVTCTTSDNFLSWKLTKTGSTDQITRTLSSTIRNPEILMVNSTVFTFVRISALGSTPLVSNLRIGPVRRNLNETEIVCTEVGLSPMKAITSVYIIGDRYMYHLDSPEIIHSIEDFRMDNITISLEWQSKLTQELNDTFDFLVSYYVNVNPSIGTRISVIDATRANLTVSYNIQYNVSIFGVFCDQMNRKKSTIYELMYANCGNPLDQHFDNFTIFAIGYSNPALEGDIATFSCIQHGFLLNGSNFSTCMGNGKWEPDPRNLECKAEDTLHVWLSESVNSSHTTDFKHFEPRKTQTDNTKEIIVITIGTLIGAGAITLTIASIILIMFANRKAIWPMSANDNQQLLSNIHLHLSECNQEPCEKEDQKLPSSQKDNVF